MTRDLDVGGVLSRIFGIYGDQAGILLPAAAVVFVIQAIIAAVLVSIAPVLILVALLINVVASTLYAGMVVELVSDVQDGRRDHTAGSLVKAVTGVVVMLIAAGFVVGILVAIGFVLLIIPGLILLTIFSVVAPAIVIERKGVFDAMSRSRELVKDNGLKVFAVIVVVFLITVVLSAIIGAIGGAAGDAGAIVAQIIASVLTAPVAALATAVLYFELRRAKGEVGPAPDAPGRDAVDPPTTAQSPFGQEPGSAGPEAAFGPRE